MKKSAIMIALFAVLVYSGCSDGERTKITSPSEEKVEKGTPVELEDLAGEWEGQVQVLMRNDSDNTSWFVHFRFKDTVYTYYVHDGAGNKYRYYEGSSYFNVLDGTVTLGATGPYPMIIDGRYIPSSGDYASRILDDRLNMLLNPSASFSDKLVEYRIVMTRDN